ncbi:DNA replication/checkpoint protein [Terfezia claveryi]|nr:DNA replication/checkpoint protein [Terfezia claveryi]
MAFTEYSQSLRLELKQWETTFAAEKGRKPSREDIKKAPEIAAKYKEYSKLRDPPPAPAIAPSQSPRTKAPSQLLKTPRKPKSRHGLTQANSNNDPFLSPSIRRSNRSNAQGSSRGQRLNAPSETPTKPSILKVPGTPLFELDSPLKIRKIRFGKDGETVGPTPQKTGKVLGLFETMMIEYSPKRIRGSMQKELKKATSESPSQSSNGLLETPRKRKLNPDDVEDSTSIRAASSVAGSVSRSGAATIVPDGETPRKRRPEPDMFATPSFLRRSTSRLMDESLLSSPPVPLPQPMKPKLVKGLSSWMADLRRMQDEILEDEMENLRELEREASGGVKKPLFPATDASATSGVASGDVFGTQGGEDDNETENPAAKEGTGASGDASGEGEIKSGDAPTRMWKKRGLKRQTRRVKMRPVRDKPLQALSAPGGQSENEEVSGDETASKQKSKPPPEAEHADEGSSEDEISNYSGSEAESKTESAVPEAKPIGRIAKKKTTTNVTTTTASTTTMAGKGKRAATAGANYCKLKIRTQGGMKGRGGGFRGRGGGRFNRRR